MAGEESASDAESDVDEDGAGKIRNSAALMGDLEEIKQKVDRFQSRRELDAMETVKDSREAVLSCYRLVIL